MKKGPLKVLVFLLIIEFVFFNVKVYGQATNSHVNRILGKPGDVEWVQDMQVILGIGHMPDSKIHIDEWMRDMDFDFNDWCMSGQLKYTDTLKTYGIYSSGAQYQWTSFWDSETPWIKGKERETLIEKGVGIDIHGKQTIGDVVWGKRYSMCPSRPAWKNFLNEENQRLLPYYGAINLDVFRPWKGGQGFCPECQEIFRGYVKTHYSKELIKEMGINDLVKFDMIEYIKDVYSGKETPEMRDDPIIRAYILAQNLSQKKHMEDFIKEIHIAEKKYGRSIPVTGNAKGLLWSATNDFIQNEIDVTQGYFRYPHYHLAASTIKLYQAVGGNKKPVWLRGGIYDRIPNPGKRYGLEIPLYGQVFQDLAYGEAFANGAVRVFNLTHEEGGTIMPKGEFRSPFYNRFIDYSNLIHDHRSAFQDRENIGEVALIYPFSTTLWESPGVFDFGNSTTSQRFDAWGQFLDESHIPYQAIVLGHPELLPDTNLYDQLTRFRVVIIPNAVCLTEEQAAAIRDYVRNGGGLVWTGELGIRNANYELYNDTLLSDLPRLPFGYYGKGRVAGLYEDDLRFGKKRMENLEVEHQDYHTMEVAMGWAGNGRRQIETNASPGTQFNFWLAENRLSASLHMVNYDVDLTHDYVCPQRDVRVKVRMPENLKSFDRVTLVCPGEDDRELSYSKENDFVLFTIPEIRVWSMVVFSSGDEQGAATALANARKQIRKHVVLNADVSDWLEEYERVFSIYSSGDYSRAVRDARILEKEAYLLKRK